MNFEIRFEELTRLILAKSDDYERMHGLLKELRRDRELVRFLAPAQDDLYASIAHGHRKALACLESGDIAAAKNEMAGPLSWFLTRFGGTDRNQLKVQLNELKPKLPRVAHELEATLNLAERSDALKAALSRKHDIHANLTREASPSS